jgi:hypothetical protein
MESELLTHCHHPCKGASKANERALIKYFDDHYTQRIANEADRLFAIADDDRECDIIL